MEVSTPMFAPDLSTDALSSSMPRRKVALLTNIPAPYRVELFNQLQQHHDLKVFFDAASEPNRKWNPPAALRFPHRYLASRVLAYQRKRQDGVPGEQRFRQLSLQLIPALLRFRPDIVISAELGIRTLQAHLYCALARKPLFIWWEGTPHTEGWVGKRQVSLRRYLIRRAARFWSNGAESSTLLGSYGAPSSRIDEAMMCTDTERLARETESALAGREEFRERLGLRGVVFLFVGRFIKHKGIVQFLDALERLAARTAAPFSALLLGDGPDRALLEDWTRRHPLQSVRVVDFQQPDALPGFYAAGDVFVLPTLDDNWSLVALEAAAAGLPQIFSSFNGASSDLRARQAPGVVVNPTDLDAFCQALQRYAENPPARIPPADRRDIIQFYSAQACAERAAQSVDRCCAGWDRSRAAAG